MQAPPLLITIIGPTAIGKTALAIALAKHYGSEILSCDSRQFYKEMRIGTAVPSPEELAAVPHHCIQHISIEDTYNVGNFETEALQLLNQLFQKNPIQIMVGGSGLYVDAVLHGFDEFPTLEGTIRETINHRFEEEGLAYLQETLQSLDPHYFNKLTAENPQTLQNPQRMKRFVEVCLGTGKPYSSFIGKKEKVRPFQSICIGLEAERHELYDRINRRVDHMMADGLLEEVRTLYPQRHLNALQTVGYRELFAYLEGDVDLPTAIENIKMNTRRFAKRQMTWFKRDPNTLWFPYTTPWEEIVKSLPFSTKERNL
ncbi:MAG: tRNA (adenosine(37)-N6)-dimethylallyltransferase MiaA [Flavobacterium sp.]|jgi:tRNA dimethylallyltransferase|uniref:tRNA (adenosine(37)-N6)-dimethylallyltransferase MiaA n=1 Tax=Flavobacterium sp. TaxID=239 RepID=UPI0022C602FB|nr:tRNA (adenosine(37)-N6)-dimethylallyltransferase MiaA [Flavobacterium sp.]MCZ8167578.1 tRNA (adenosine(37)-N6)-dimethylallyltransferase MiaA [Flavobacterium sp.]MCZ8297774.1 tRNA (adenosine(37)-N6)-dimethylallyltransferase MiaA [Flavobacterium sp.]